jgi:hypothetical protein
VQAALGLLLVNSEPQAAEASLAAEAAVDALQQADAVIHGADVVLL